VLVALADRANANGGSCHPGITELTRRASTSRRRVIAAIQELETFNVVCVQRSASWPGMRRNVNRYELAVGQEIKIPVKPVRSAAKKGTVLVPMENQVGSLGGTVTTTEPSINHHSDTDVSARFLRRARMGAISTNDWADHDQSATGQFPDLTMRAAAETLGTDPERLSDVIADYRGDLAEQAKAGNLKAQKQYRALWFAVLKGKVPDLEDKV
jgi:hypothetical protein